MSQRKGPRLEEVVRTYFARQGFFALRGVDLRFEGDKVTDIDVWLYGRLSASARTRTIVDVKDKRSPKAFERILWTRGMQLALGCDRAVVATTYNNPKAKRFAQEQGVALLHKEFLDRLRDRLDLSNRISEEQFAGLISAYKEHKLDGDWLRIIADVKSALISLSGYPAFNKAMTAFGYFSERSLTRSQHREQAIRGAYVSAAIACIALDSALEQSLYEGQRERYKAIANGVTYGDSGDLRTQKSIRAVLDVISSGLENGQVVARQVQTEMDNLFSSVRADMVAEFFSKEHNASTLFAVAKELDNGAYVPDIRSLSRLSIEAKSVLGVFCDFVQAKRSSVLLSDNNGLSDAIGENSTFGEVQPDEKADGECDDSSKSQESLL